MNGSMDRRKFIQASALGGASLGLAPATIRAFASGAPSDAIRVAVMGVNSRGGGLANSFAQQSNASIRYICDVDARAARQVSRNVDRMQDEMVEGIPDFRRALEDPDVDVLVIAAPDHWHAPATILGLQAGKHVYVEKPCGHNPREGELLVAAQERYGGVVQMGTQQRSGPATIEAIRMIHDGVIGRPYKARAWYANTRGSIGRGKTAPVPGWLDYELWQGPAPRTPYRDNVVHYNWHWFWHWGTGEVCNNGTHEIDVARWALGVNFPVRVNSNGGRYHFDDDWEFYDTQDVAFDFEEGKTITWEGRSCNGFPVLNRGRGTVVHGTEGTILIDRNGYVLYDEENAVVKEVKEKDVEATMDTTGGGGQTNRHIANFLEAIRDGRPLHSPIDEGHKSVLLCHLANIAQKVGETLHCDPGNGHITGNPEAMELWARDYEPGWEPMV